MTQVRSLDLIEPVVGMISARIDESPDRVAIEWSGGAVTFGQLGGWSGDVGRRLQALGMAPGDRVAVAAIRSPGAVAALLGVMAAGGVFVPLDRSLPDLRRRLLLDRSQARWLVTVGDDALSGSLPGVQIDEWPDGDPHAGLDPVDRHRSDPAYVYFTSGSTGTPKGVVGCHLGLAQFVDWMSDELEITSRDRVSLIRSLSFDASLREIFLPLATGATLVIAPNDFDPDVALRWLVDRRITILNATPSHAAVWLEGVAPQTEASLRWVCFSGERLDGELVRRWRTVFGSCARVANLYGPTETTMVRTFGVVDEDPEDGPLPVGHPLPFTTIRVERPDGSPCEGDEPGEVVIDTRVGTLGYVDGDGAGRFTMGPGGPGDIVYRTGDRGWWRPDGSLVVSGRLDDQVQILGLRVEPGEVETIFAAHPDIDRAVVLAEDLDTGTRLAAFVRVTDGAVGDPHGWRAYLLDRLPSPAVPSRFVTVDTFPVTTNGKVDRPALLAMQALPEPVSVADRMAALSPSKRALLERRLAASKDSETVASRLAGLAGLSPEQRALVVERLRAKVAADTRHAPLSFAQERLWFLDRLYPGRGNYNITRCHRLEGSLDLEALRVALDTIHGRHEALRTRFAERDGDPVQVVDPPGPAPLEIVDLTDRADPEDDLAEIVEREANVAFDLSTGPVWKVTAVRLAPTSYALIVVIHHIASDGWSLPPFFRELTVAYAAAVDGVEPELPGLPIQYADYSTRQRQKFESGGFEEDLDFWERELRGGPELLTLPGSKTRPAVPSHDGGRVRFEVPSVPIEAITDLCRTHSATPFMVGLALVQGYLARVAGRDDIVIGVPSADRVSTDTQDLVGFFVNTLAMRSRIAPEMTFRDLLAAVRDTAVRSYDHREVPFEHVVQRLQPRRSTDRSPIFQVMYQFGTGEFSAPLELVGLEAERIERESRKSKFDMTMYLGAGDGVLGGNVVYARDLFDPESISSLVDGFAAFASAALADPDLRLDELPPSGAERVSRDGLVQTSAPITGVAATGEPVSDETSRLAEIWSDLLARPVGPDDDFFSLGGHSLLAIRMLSRVEAEFGLALPIASVFERPTPRGLALLLTGEQGTGVDPAAEAQGVSVRAPLSYAQRRLWFLDRLYPEAGNYHTPFRRRLVGELSLEALSYALDLIVERHAVFRTRFEEEDGVPVQVIDPARPVPIAVDDLSMIPESERAERLGQVLSGESRRPFDLSTDLLLRARVVRLADDDHVLSLVAHHIATDAESMAILRRELREAYAARLDGREPDLASLPLRYVDFAARQSTRFADEAESGLAWWVDRLAGVDPVLDLPIDRIRPSRAGHEAGTVSARIDGGVPDGLADLARSTRATPFMVLLAAFGVLLRRYTGVEDLVVGIPSTERTELDTEHLIGFFVNSLPIRFDVASSATFRETVEAVRDVTVAALSHRDVPFEAIVDRVGVPRDPSRAPLFQVMFDVTQPSGGRFSLPGTEPIPIGVRSTARPAKFDLRLHCRLGEDDLRSVFEYRLDLFDRASIETMSEHFSALLTALVADPDRPVQSVPMLTERDQSIRAEDETCAWPTSESVVERFHRVASRRGRATAIRQTGRSISYLQLARAARDLGDALIQAGVRPGATVGVSLPRSAALVVAVLGVLEAGATYVPLDPSYPAERLAAIRRDAGLSAVLRPGQGGLLAVDVETVDGAGPVVDPADRVAYVMYTSGSTGSPKGVLVPERAISRLVVESDYVTLAPSDVVAFASNTAFDAATFEVWGALLNGAVLQVIDRDTMISPERLAESLRRYDVSTMFVTTALFNTVMAHRPDAFASLDTLLFGGEAVDVASVRRCLSGGRPRRLVHVYGPTETTTFATWHEIDDVSGTARTVPIGRPIRGATARVVDTGGETVGIGIPGELVIGGPGVALGYLGDPEKTADRFVPRSDGAVEYRTGDRVRRRHDGAIEFLGRMDRQLKMRGFRIEPGEIESQLMAHPAVREAAVVPWHAQTGLRLAAYVVANGVEAGHLLDHLAGRLPSFMVPSSLQLIDALPHTPNGKLDQSALPEPAAIGAPYVPPTGEAMERMAELWKQVLGVSRVGADDDFFALGGHSLLAIQLFAGIEEVFGRTEPLSSIFEASTLGSLTARVTGGPAEGSSAVPDGVVVIRPGADRPPVFCLPPAGGNVFVYEPMARGFEEERPVYGVQAPGTDGRTQPLRTIEELAAHCERLIVDTHPEGPYLLAGYSMGGLVAWEVARRLTGAGRTVELLALIDARLVRLPTASERVRRDIRIIRTRRIRGVQAVARGAARSLRRAAGVVRHGPGAVISRLLGRPLSPLQAGRRLTAAGIEATAAFRPEPYEGSVVYLRAGSRSGPWRRPPDGPWQELATGGVEVIDVPGTHKGSGSMMHEPNAGLLAKEIRAVIERNGGL